MKLALRSISVLMAGSLLCLPFVNWSDRKIASAPPNVTAQSPGGGPASKLAADYLARRAGCFVPNLGQWDSRSRFVHRSGATTVFLQDRGWTLDLRESAPRPQAKRPDAERERALRGVGLRMTFTGAATIPELVAENELPGLHNYFLGRDESRWRTDVPRYASVRYVDLYRGIDLRLRELNGVPEYDLLLQPGADLSSVNVHVEGADGLSIAEDGSLVIATPLGLLTQPTPKTWQVDAAGRKREVLCKFTLLAADRFGFEVDGWDGQSGLTIDPGLIWSTFLGGTEGDYATGVAVDGGGVVTVSGGTTAVDFPATVGVYDATYNGLGDLFVSRLDSRQTGSAQLMYATFLGGSLNEEQWKLSRSARGVITLAGRTSSADFPTTSDAYRRNLNGGGGNYDFFITVLDPSRAGTAQLVYSTYLGGSSYEWFGGYSVDSLGVVTVAGFTWSVDYPTTPGAYDTAHAARGDSDVVISRLDPTVPGRAGLLYSTFLGFDNYDYCGAVSADDAGVITVAGNTLSTGFPTTPGAYDRTHNGGNTTWTGGDMYLARLDPSRAGSAQLVYSTFLGGDGDEFPEAISVDAGGVITMVGFSSSSDYPSSRFAYDRSANSGGEAVVSRVDPSLVGAAQLAYSTYISGWSIATAVAVDAEGVITVAGSSQSATFPTTSDAYDRTFAGKSKPFVCRLDPRGFRQMQLVYSTFLGGSVIGTPWGLIVDGSGTATVTGSTASPDFPTTPGAYDRTFSGGDVFISRLDMGVAFYGDGHAIPVAGGGVQRLTINAGKANRNRPYWIFGSASGTRPGITINGALIPLNPDPYTDLAMAFVNTGVFTRFRGTLNADGEATAEFRLPVGLPIPPGLQLHHAYVVYDLSGRFHKVSNPVPVVLE